MPGSAARPLRLPPGPTRLVNRLSAPRFAHWARACRHSGCHAAPPGKGLLRRPCSLSSLSSSRKPWRLPGRLRSFHGGFKPHRADVESDVFTPTDVAVRALEGSGRKPPRLHYGLDRVLFNPGVYHLQDTRSRVYNFDPYLEKILCATEFNFDALASYVTASKDDSFYELLRQSNMKFGASTSGMTDLLCQLHYLISHWRKLNLDSLSQGFEEASLRFSEIRRMPVSVFLRYRDGRYVIDPDNQTTSYCELMFVGRLLEKLFTVPKNVFEQFRRRNTQAAALRNLEEENVHNYTAFGPVLVRSQLDAYDPRLPGTGVFDLKTRAVAGVRFDAGERLKDSRGYQIKGNLGTWESYEREMHDLARTVLMKYALQVRLGRMDGIFVAYHNLERIFGFQYLSLADMDNILHGQEHPDLGDKELNLSFSLLGEILDRATKAYPEQSLWLHMHTRGGEQRGCVGRVCIEPISEDLIDSIAADAKQAEIEYEKRLLKSHHNGPANRKPESAGGELTLVEAIHDLKAKADKLAQFLDQAAAAHGDQARSLNAGDMESLIGGLLDLRLKIEGLTDRMGRSAAPDDSASAMLEAAKEFVDGAFDKLKDLPDDVSLASEGVRDQPLPYFMRHQVGPLVALEIRARQSANGETVLRPESYQRARGDHWDVDFDIQTLAPRQAHELYAAMRNTRSRLLREEAWYEQYYRTSFMAHISSLSERGRSWREALDRLDHQRERVVFEPHEA